MTTVPSPPPVPLQPAEEPSVSVDTPLVTPTPPPAKSPRFKKQHILAAIFIFFLVTIPITVYYISGPQQIAELRKFAKEKGKEKEKDKEKKKDKDKDKSQISPSPTETAGITNWGGNKTQTVTVGKFADAVCPWNQGDNGKPDGGNVSARVQKDTSFSLESGCTLLGANITSNKEPSVYLFDDTLHILIDGNVVAGPSELIPPLVLGEKWDWSAIVTKNQESQHSVWKCIGTPCQAPQTYKHHDGSTKPLVNMGLSKDNLSKLLTASGNTHTFSAAVIGDNNQESDCKLNEDLTLTLFYSCAAVTSTATPTNAATATNTPTATPIRPPDESPTPTSPPRATPTPRPPSGSATPTPLPTPKVPVAGIGPSVLGISIISLGSLLVLLGLAL